MTDMRDNIARIVADEKNGGDPYDIAEDIMAALPGMVAPLVWDLQGDWDYRSGGYSIWLWQATGTPHPVWVLYLPDQTRATRRSLEDAKAAAQAYHAAAVVAAFTGSKQ